MQENSAVKMKTMADLTKETIKGSPVERSLDLDNEGTNDNDE